MIATATKKDKTIYWIFTILIVLTEGVMPALTFNSSLAKQGIAHLGYPDYFRIELTIGKIIGCIILILPFISKRLKEWAYVGLGIDFISAFIGLWYIDGLNGETLFPLIMIVTLIVSYIYFHKIYKVYAND